MNHLKPVATTELLPAPGPLAGDVSSGQQGVLADSSEAALVAPIAATGNGAARRSEKLAAKWDLRTDTLLSGVMFLVAATVCQQFLGLARNILFCRWVVPAELGLWDISNGFLMFVSPLLALGLPGTLTRYVEYFRRRGQLRRFLIGIFVGLTLFTGLAAIITFQIRDHVGQFLFGGSDSRLVMAIAFSLISMGLFGLFAKFFVAMRLQRVASLMSFSYSLTFTVLGGVLIFFWRPTATSIVTAHCAAMFLTCLLVSVWVWQLWYSLPAGTESSPAETSEDSGVWFKVVCFALAIWVTNALTNAFAMVDRYMIVHFSNLGTAAALAMAGQYFAARIVPRLMVTIATGFAFQMLPHLARDWEAGRRDEVTRQFDFTLRLTGLGSFAFASLILAAGPTLFALAFDNKFDQGLSVLGLTLASGVIFTMFVVGKLYLWCCEKAWIVTLSFLCCLLINIGGNLILLPAYGLWGAATANCFAVLVLLLVTYGFSHWLGVRFRAATIIISLLPLLLIAGAPLAVSTAAGLLLAALKTELVFSLDEKQQMTAAARKLWKRITESVSLVFAN